MYWEKELRRKITRIASQHCPQQESRGGSRSSDAAVELQPLHHLPPPEPSPSPQLPSASGDWRVVLVLGEDVVWAQNVKPRMPGWVKEFHTKTLQICGLWGYLFGTFIFFQLIWEHSTIGFLWELPTNLGNFFACNLIPVLTGCTVKFSGWKKAYTYSECWHNTEPPVNSHVCSV